jgi:HCO3- transporter family
VLKRKYHHAWTRQRRYRRIVSSHNEQSGRRQRGRASSGRASSAFRNCTIGSGSLKFDRISGPCQLKLLSSVLSRSNSIGSVDHESLLSSETPKTTVSLSFTSRASTGEHTSKNESNVGSLPKATAKHQHEHRQRVRQTTDSTFIISNRNKANGDAHYDGFFDLPTNPEDYCINQDVLDDLTDDGTGSFRHHQTNLSLASNKRSQTCGRGIVDDFKTTVGKHWLQEMRTFNSKIAAATLFLFFACIAPAITFGAMHGKMTHNRIGTVEMLVATAWGGIVFALVGGQPVMINGGTGPVLAFSGVLYKLSESIGVPFLTFSAWVGLWVSDGTTIDVWKLQIVFSPVFLIYNMQVCLYMLVAAFVDLNRVIRYATRFTDEIFALLIAAIFVIDALGSPFHEVGIYYYFVSNHTSHEKYAHDPEYDYVQAAFLSLTLCIGTTVLACFLRGIKHSPYLWWTWLRNGCSDFAVSIAIFTFALVAHCMFPNIHTEELKVPDTISPTFQCCDSDCTIYFPDDCPDQWVAYGRRKWIVDLSDLNGKAYVPFVAALPAILAFILIFLDSKRK